MGIAHNLERVGRRIKEAALRVGRDPNDIRLLVVSKNMPPDFISEAYQAKQRIFAESRVREWQEKISVLPADCEWHLIGRIQTNKVKYLDDRIALIHSLDRYELLTELEKQGIKKGLIWKVLIQVNIANDPAKAGLDPCDVKDFLKAVTEYSHVQIKGLMTIGRLDATEEETRQSFRELRERRDLWQKQASAGICLQQLSMGMSNDYEIAVEEGATMVRLGQQIFGGEN